MRSAAWSCIGLVAVAVVAVASACREAPDPPPTDLSCDGQPDRHCAHPIDRLLVPRLRALGVPIADGGAEELCRRMAIDLIGRGPTSGELATCRAATPAQIFDLFADQPDYLREQRRAWAELFEYDVRHVWSTDLVDFDRLAGDAYAGTIDYAEFATRAAMHPVFYGLHPGDSWTAHLWSVFLGRAARADELEAMRPLTRAWVSREVCDGAMWWGIYQAARARGVPEAPAVTLGNTACWDVAKEEWGLNPCGCRAGALGAGCAADVLGLHVELTAACANPADPGDPANLVRAAGRAFGSNKCPNGELRPECVPRLIDRSTPYAFQPHAQWATPPPRLLAELRGIGIALAARGDFWEAAADRELKKLLGWWQSTFRHPDSDLPEVRALLAAQLRATGSLRDLQRTIVTSLLYTQPGAAPAVDGAVDLPPWVAGPTKLLAGAPWLATAAAAVGEQAGRCDFRWVTAGGYAPVWANPNHVEPMGGTLDVRTHAGYSLEALLRLSACTSETRRPALSDIGFAFATADIAHALCAYGTGVLPPGFTGNYDTAARYLITRIWHRSPDEAELGQMIADMTACQVAPATGCGSPEIAVRWMCQRMIDSAQFATY
jgi:hypothetical protein